VALASKWADRALMGGTLVAGRSDLPVGLDESAGVVGLDVHAAPNKVNDAAA